MLAHCVKVMDQENDHYLSFQRPQTISRMTSLNALRMFKQGADEEKAEVARLSSFVGAMAIGDLVKSTLGPKV